MGPGVELRAVAGTAAAAGRAAGRRAGRAPDRRAASPGRSAGGAAVGAGPVTVPGQDGHLVDVLALAVIFCLDVGFPGSVRARAVDAGRRSCTPLLVFAAVFHREVSGGRCQMCL